MSEPRVTDEQAAPLTPERISRLREDLANSLGSCDAANTQEWAAPSIGEWFATLDAERAERDALRAEVEAWREDDDLNGYFYRAPDKRAAVEKARRLRAIAEGR
jgi:hypothetical protein